MMKLGLNRPSVSRHASHVKDNMHSVSDHARVKRAAVYVWAVVLLAAALGLLAWWRILSG